MTAIGSPTSSPSVLRHESPITEQIQPPIQPSSSSSPSPSSGTVVISKKGVFPLHPILRATIVNDACNSLSMNAAFPTSHVQEFDPFKRTFEHVCSPNIVCILRPLDEVMKMVNLYKQANQIIQKYQLSRCFVPSYEIQELKDDKVVLDEKDRKKYGFVLLDKSQVILKPFGLVFEMMEKEFAQFGKSPALRAKWEEIFTQAADFVCLTGYSPHMQNMNFLDDKIGFIIPNITSGTQDDAVRGISRLLRLAPVELFDQILSVLVKHFPKTDKNDPQLTKAEQERAAEVQLRQNHRNWLQEKGITASGFQIDASRFTEGSLESQIIQKCNIYVCNPCRFEFYGGALTFERNISWQPLYKKEEYPVNRQAFEEALSNLKRQGLIFDFSITENAHGQPELVLYHIYC